jgi:hypothetical protein
MIHLTIHVINVKRKFNPPKGKSDFFLGAYYAILCICQGNHFYPLGYHDDLGKILKNKT